MAQIPAYCALLKPVCQAQLSTLCLVEASTPERLHTSGMTCENMAWIQNGLATSMFLCPVSSCMMGSIPTPVVGKALAQAWPPARQHSWKYEGSFQKADHQPQHLFRTISEIRSVHLSIHEIICPLLGSSILGVRLIYIPHRSYWALMRILAPPSRVVCSIALIIHTPGVSKRC